MFNRNVPFIFRFGSATDELNGVARRNCATNDEDRTNNNHLHSNRIKSILSNSSNNNNNRNSSSSSSSNNNNSSSSKSTSWNLRPVHRAVFPIPPIIPAAFIRH
jgi:hypothetical protein